MFAFTIGSVTLSLVDIIIFALCMISAVFCCIRGFVMELSKWAGLALGIVVAIMFTSQASPFVSSLLLESIPHFASTAIAFVALVLIGFLAVLIVGRMMKKIVETFKLSVFDHILGFVWGLAFSLFIVGAIVYLLGMQTVFDLSEFFNSSVIIKNFILPFMPQTEQAIETVVEGGLSLFRGAEEAAPQAQAALESALEGGRNLVQEAGQNAI